MKTFLKWLEDQKYELPAFNDSPDSEEATSEDAKRSGISYNYPDAYKRAQYPHKYFNPVSPTADYQLSAKPRKGSADTAAN